MAMTAIDGGSDADGGHRAMNEFEVIGRYFDRRGVAATADGRVVLGIGDDCALLRPPAAGQLLAISSDMLVEGRHFLAGSDASAVGHKTLAVNLSDLAAMGAEPLGFTLSVALPAIDPDWLERFTQGLFALADAHRCPLVGGDTTRGPLCLSVTVFGSVPEATALRRDGACVGDDIWVSGPLGGAAAAVEGRGRGEPGDARRAAGLDRPRPRLALGRALLGVASAALDVSDGTVGDLAHVLDASTRRQGRPLGAVLEAEWLPVDPALSARDRTQALQWALHGGDDYELVFTAAASQRDRLAGLQCHDGFVSGAPIRIGSVVAQEGVRLHAADGTSRLVAGGFDHFATP